MNDAQTLLKRNIATKRARQQLDSNTLATLHRITIRITTDALTWNRNGHFDVPQHSWLRFGSYLELRTDKLCLGNKSQSCQSKQTIESMTNSHVIKTL